MQVYRIDPRISQLDNVKKLLVDKEEILHTYEVVPLDYRISDYFSPKFYITEKRLIFAFDEAIEVFQLDNLEIFTIGMNPEFSVREAVLSSNKLYLPNESAVLDRLKNDENLTRISINEPKQVPKYFLVREGYIISKSYKVWALSQLIQNTKLAIKNNEMLINMLGGFFHTFNQKTLLYFIYIFVGYLVLRILSNFFLRQIGIVLDVIFGISVIFMLYWLYITIEKNMKKYEAYFHTFKGVN